MNPRAWVNSKRLGWGKNWGAVNWVKYFYIYLMCVDRVKLGLTWVWFGFRVKITGWVIGMGLAGGF